MFKFAKMNNDAIIPSKGSSGSAGFDLHAVTETVIFAGSRGLVKTGIALQLRLRLSLDCVMASIQAAVRLHATMQVARGAMWEVENVAAAQTTSLSATTMEVTVYLINSYSGCGSGCPRFVGKLPIKKQTKQQKL